MKLARPLLEIALMLGAGLGLFALQRGGGFRGGPQSLDAFSPYTGERLVPSEFYFSRLRYNSGYASGGSFAYRAFRGGWSQDCPRADNDCLIVLRRLTRIDAPAPLNVVDINDNSM